MDKIYVEPEVIVKNTCNFVKVDEKLVGCYELDIILVIETN